MRKRKKFLIVLVAFVLVVGIGFAALSSGYNYFMKQVYPIKYSEIVQQEAKQNGLDEAIVYSVIKAESNFNPDAESHAGALGLMQLTPETFEWMQTKITSEVPLSTEDLFKPEINIRYGCKLLAILFEIYEERETALCAYNAGIGTVNGWLKKPELSSDGISLISIPYPETEKYAKAVIKNYKIYQELYQYK